MTTTRLVNGDICIGLFSRAAGDFHWLIAIPTDISQDVFIKLHAKDTFAGLWSYERAEHHIMGSISIVCLIKIGEPLSYKRHKRIWLNVSSLTTGKCGDRTVDDTDSILERLDMATPREFGGRKTRFDCRVWIRMAVTALGKAGIIQCSDVLMLERECEEKAEEARDEGAGLQILTSEYSLSAGMERQ